ncbi:CoA ester lyase [Allopontixanthobacter sp.]|uniref:HpcH/HpaI aldolase/citrate lyase family protein n=1 Tax=Allopontixanthobacter sp. TaxID=2906452 RepID=UPI002ABC5852|nr:CoA ester lyase [Allopontixanthobacter sp.]MDZ4307066.1 CoA ester lyase [Allopontixanthobacter sp.]
MKYRPLRTALYLPANRASAVAKAREADCDAVILDLEDAVAPEAKGEAREAAIAAARAGGFGDRLLVVRVNALDSEWGAADCAALQGLDRQADAAAVLVPKLSSARQLSAYRTAVGDGPELWAMLETCAAFLDLPAIAAAAKDAGLTTFVLGTNDLALEMRCTLDTGRSAMLPLLTQSVVAARAHGLAVLDGVFNALENEAGFAAQCRQGAMLGFDGKTVIHPAQLTAANAAFGPSERDIADAAKIVAAFAAPENAGKGVIRLDGRMVEVLHLRQAERTLAISTATRRDSA